MLQKIQKTNSNIDSCFISPVTHFPSVLLARHNSLCCLAFNCKRKFCGICSMYFIIPLLWQSVLCLVLSGMRNTGDFIPVHKKESPRTQRLYILNISYL